MDGLGLRGAGFGAAWSPIFGRKGNAPELRTRRGEFEADFRLFAAHRAQENNVAFLFFFSAIVLELEHAAAGDARAQEYQRAVSVDGQRIGFFAEIFALRVVAGNLNADLHQHALAAAANTYIGWVWLWLGHGEARLPFNSL
jgi:hypothetical protein